MPGVKDATVTFRVEMYGGRVVGERTSVSLGDSVTEALDPGSGWLTFLKVLAWIYLPLLGIYSIVRYVRRRSTAKSRINERCWQPWRSC